MAKVVINTSAGGFSLSREALHRLREMGNRCALGEDEFCRVWTDTGAVDLVPVDMYCRGIKRDDPDLIEVIEEMGDDANGQCARLRIIEIPDDIDWVIEEHDGREWVAEKHRTWHAEC